MTGTVTNEAVRQAGIHTVRTTVSTKLIAAVMAVAVIGGGGAAAVYHARHIKQESAAVMDTRADNVNNKEEVTTSSQPDQKENVPASPVPASFEDTGTGDSTGDMIDYIKSQLGIPADLETQDVVDFNHPYYWEGGDMWLVNCEFYHNGKLVAAAMVDQQTGELARNIMVYTEE